MLTLLGILVALVLAITSLRRYTDVAGWWALIACWLAVKFCLDTRKRKGEGKR